MYIFTFDCHIYYYDQKIEGGDEISLGIFLLDIVSTSTHRVLDHVRSLCPEVLDGVKDVHDALSLHPLDGRAEGAEGSCSAYTSTAINNTTGSVSGSKLKPATLCFEKILTRRTSIGINYTT